jgi:hypothetical protein
VLQLCIRESGAAAGTVPYTQLQTDLVIRIFYRNYGWEIDPLGAAVTGEMDDIAGSSDCFSLFDLEPLPGPLDSVVGACASGFRPRLCCARAGGFYARHFKM